MEYGINKKVSDLSVSGKLHYVKSENFLKVFEDNSL